VFCPALKNAAAKIEGLKLILINQDKNRVIKAALG
jgi:hypothetical protein